MSRIDEALRRARDGRLPDPPAVGPTIEEYPHEHLAGSDGDNRLQSVGVGPAAAPVSTAPVSTTPVSTAPWVLDLPFGLTRQCQRIATVLQDRQSQGPLKTVAIASASNGDGRTSTLLGLAVALTRTKSTRVLLVDGDLCKPALHEVVRIKQSTGLTDVISGERHEALPVVMQPFLHVLLAGCPSTNPALDLGSERLRALLVQCASRYDWVLVDTPAMSQLLDEADVLGRLADGVVFVVGATTPFTVAERAMAMIGEDRILGTVLNGLADPASQS